jgi:hypothetical protein
MVDYFQGISDEEFLSFFDDVDYFENIPDEILLRAVRQYDLRYEIIYDDRSPHRNRKGYIGRDHTGEFWFQKSLKTGRISKRGNRNRQSAAQRRWVKLETTQTTGIRQK